MISWPQPLIDSLARRKCVIVIGSGVSANSKNDKGEHPPTWKGFLEKILEVHNNKFTEDNANNISKMIVSGNLIDACEIEFNIIGEHAFYESAKDMFLRGKYKASEFHKIIFNLDAQIYITPNVDKIFDTYANNVAESSILILSYKDNIASKLRSEDRMIIKYHGKIDDETSMIFTQTQYNKARNENSKCYDVISALALTHTFFFIGCGTNDPDIKLLFEDMNYSHEGCPPHYMLIDDNELTKEMEKVVSKNRNIEFIRFNLNVEDNVELLNGLNELYKMTDEKRCELHEAYALY